MAPTPAYDCVISDTTTPVVLRAVEVPTLALRQHGQPHDLTGWAASVAAQPPRATHRSLPGEWHRVADETLAPVLAEFFRGSSGSDPSVA